MKKNIPLIEAISWSILDLIKIILAGAIIYVIVSYFDIWTMRGFFPQDSDHIALVSMWTIIISFLYIFIDSFLKYSTSKKYN